MIRIFTVTTAVILTNYAVFASDESTRWPQFRGPNGTGVSSEDKPLPVRFGPSDAVIWKTELPHGHSSPCVWDDRIFLTGFHPTQKRLETICIDRQSGKVLWKRTAPTQMIERVQPVSSPATATPRPSTEALRRWQAAACPRNNRSRNRLPSPRCGRHCQCGSLASAQSR